MNDITTNAEQFHNDVVHALSHLIYFSNPRMQDYWHNPSHEVAAALCHLVTLSKEELPEPCKLPERLICHMSWLQDQARQGRTDGFVPDDTDQGTDVWAVREFGRMFGDGVIECNDGLGGGTVAVPDFLLPDLWLDLQTEPDAETQRLLKTPWSSVTA